jgi:hypothetical protein
MGDLAGGAALAPDTGASPHRRRPTTAHPIAGPHGYLGRTPEISPPRYHRLPLPRGEAELRLPSGSSSTVVDHCLLFLFRVAPHLPTAECPRSRQPSGATTTLPPALPRPCRRISGSHSGAKAPRRHLGRRRAQQGCPPPRTMDPLRHTSNPVGLRRASTSPSSAEPQGNLASSPQPP